MSFDTIGKQKYSTREDAKRACFKALEVLDTAEFCGQFSTGVNRREYEIYVGTGRDMSKAVHLVRPVEPGFNIKSNCYLVFEFLGESK